MIDSREGAGKVPARRPTPPSPLRQETRFFLQIFALNGFAVAQPLLDVFGRSPETFVFRGAEVRHVALFALAITAVPAVGLWLLGLCTRLFGSRARGVAHYGTLGLLISLIGIQVLKRLTPLLDLALLATGVMVGAGAIALVRRSRPLRDYLSYAAVAPIVFVGIFLVGSPAAKLLRSPEISEAATPRGSRDAAKTPVVMVIFDEFPLMSLLDERGVIDEELYPNFAELAGVSTWYPNFTVTHSRTELSIPTMLTGNLARDPSKKPLAVDYPDNLFTLLRETHRLKVFESMTQLCPRELCEQADQNQEEETRTQRTPHPENVADLTGPETHTELAAPQEGGFAALIGDAAVIWAELSLPGEHTRDIMGQFAEGDGLGDGPEGEAGENAAREGPGTPTFNTFLASFEGTAAKPGLHFLHLMLPHSPWRFFPEGISYAKLPGNSDRVVRSPSPGRTQWVADPWPVQLAHQQHLLQVQFVDRLVGRLMRSLRVAGMFDDALIVLTSDHGISFQPRRDLRTVSRSNMHEILWVPLFIKAPGQRVGEVDETNIMSMDVLPTMAEILGVNVPWAVGGIPAGDPKVARRNTKLVGAAHLLEGEDEADEKSTEVRTISEAQVAIAQRRLREQAFSRSASSDGVRLRPYLVGPAPRLIGKSLDEVEEGPPAVRSVSLERPKLNWLKEVDLDSGPLPAFVWGSLRGARGGDREKVAVAVNGRIAGVSETFSWEGLHGRFALLAPSFFFRPRGNAMEFFLLEGEVLRPLQ